MKNFRKRLKLYKSIAKGKLALFCIINIFIVLLFVIQYLNKIKILLNYIEIITAVFVAAFIIVYLLYFIFISICLDIHLKYITNFMNKINFDFERKKNDFKWNMIILIMIILFPIMFGLIASISESYKNNSKKNDSTHGEKVYPSKEININQEIGKSQTNTERKEIKSELDEGVNNIENNLNVLTINDIQINEEKDNLKKELEKKDSQINNLNEIIKSKDNEIEQRKNVNLELVKKNQLLEKAREEKIQKIERYKSNLPFELKENEELICVIFICFFNQSINYPFLCKKNQIFNILENSIYEKFPQFKSEENVFLHNSFPINKLETLENNNIRNGSIIVLSTDNTNE